MEEIKLSARDVFSYFLVGFFFLICLLSVDIKDFVEALKLKVYSVGFSKEIIKAQLTTANTLLFVLPGIYIIGIIVHSIDNVIYAITLIFYNWVHNSPKIRNRLKKRLLNLIFGTREVFYHDYFEDILANSAGKIHAIGDSGYWAVSQHTNEGFYRVVCGFFIYHTCYALLSIVKCHVPRNWEYVLLFLILVGLFFWRGKILIAAVAVRKEASEVLETSE